MMYPKSPDVMTLKLLTLFHQTLINYSQDEMKQIKRMKWDGIYKHSNVECHFSQPFSEVPQEP